MTGGINQVAPAGTALPAPIVVRVTDAHTQSPVTGQPVTFVVTGDDDGHLLPGAAVTDNVGQARTRWTLGPEVGLQTLQARAVDQSTGEVITSTFITATSTRRLPGPPAAILTIGTYRVRIFGGSLSLDPVPVVYAMDFDVLNPDDSAVPCSAVHMYHVDGSELTARYTGAEDQCGFEWDDPFRPNPFPEPAVRQAWVVINGDESTRTEIWRNYWAP